MAIVIAVCRRFGVCRLRRNAAEREARPALMIRSDHVAGRDQKPEKEKQRQHGRDESTLVPDAADHAPHAFNLTQPHASQSPICD
jgi:hypothetical protein